MGESALEAHERGLGMDRRVLAPKTTGLQQLNFPLTNNTTPSSKWLEGVFYWILIDNIAELNFLHLCVEL